MKIKKLYKFSIVDESKLMPVFSGTLTPWRIFFLFLGSLLFILFTGFLLVLLTPAKNFIPGYFSNSERAMAEDAILKVARMQEQYFANEAYLENLRDVMNPHRKSVDSLEAVAKSLEVSPESLMSTSPEEKNFVKKMQQREKFNISVQSSMAAEGMLFYPISEDGIQSQTSRDSYKAEMILPVNTSVMSLADGVILASFYDKNSGGNSVIIQHDNGFASRYSGLGTLLASQGDKIFGGEILSLSRASGAKSPSKVIVELWYNGVPLKPYGYINSHKHLQVPSINSITESSLEENELNTDENL